MGVFCALPCALDCLIDLFVSGPGRDVAEDFFQSFLVRAIGA